MFSFLPLTACLPYCVSSFITTFFATLVSIHSATCFARFAFPLHSPPLTPLPPTPHSAPHPTRPRQSEMLALQSQLDAENRRRQREAEAERDERAHLAADKEKRRAAVARERERMDQACFARRALRVVGALVMCCMRVACMRVACMRVACMCVACMRVACMRVARCIYVRCMHAVRACRPCCGHCGRILWGFCGRWCGHFVLSVLCVLAAACLVCLLTSTNTTATLFVRTQGGVKRWSVKSQNYR